MIPYDWLALESAHIAKVKFVQSKHLPLRGDMLVEYRTGKTYRFKDIPAVKVEHMVHSSSPGEYLLKHIRGEHLSEAVQYE